jgi:hypothetical protein
MNQSAAAGKKKVINPENILHRASDACGLRGG